MLSRNLVWIAVVGGIACGACSSSPTTGGFISMGGSTGSGGAATDASTSNGTGGATGPSTGSGGANPSGGADGGAQGGVSGGTGGAVDAGSAGGAGGAGVVMSPGCGMAPPSPASMIGTTRYGKFTIDISAQSVLQFTAQPGVNRPVTRQYFVRLPDNYVNTQPYRVIYMGPGCSPAQDTLTTPIRQPPLDTDPNSTGALAGAILVQLQQGTYNPAAYNTGCTVASMAGCNASSAYCFDDWASEAGTPQVQSIPDGPPSGAVAMEKAYFDALHKAIEANYCVDKTRQFYSGYSSGGWLAQQLGCWFPDVLRAQANITGGIPPIINANANGANNYCVKHPIGYFSIHNNPDASNGFQGSVDGARRVFALNGCTGTFPTPPLPGATAIPAGLEIFQITNSAGRVLVPNNGNFRCYHYTTCPVASPMYFCVSTDQAHDAQGAHAAPAFWEFFSRF
jgi:hypothetical protein